MFLLIQLEETVRCSKRSLVPCKTTNPIAWTSYSLFKIVICLQANGFRLHNCWDWLLDTSKQSSLLIRTAIAVDHGHCPHLMHRNHQP